MSSNALPPGVSQQLFSLLPSYTLYFDGAGQAGNWSDPANWWTGVAPNTGSSVLVPVSATLNGGFTAKIVMLLGTETVNFNGTLTTTSTNLCESFMVCDEAVANFNAGSVLNDAGSLIVGNEDDGTLTAFGGATLNAVDTKIGRLVGGDGTVDIAGGQLANAADMVVGYYGQGTLTITNGGAVSVGTSMSIGYNQGASGQVTVASGTLAVNSVLYIGAGSGNPNGQGVGTLTVGAAGLVTAGTQIKVYGNETLVMAGGTVQTGAYAFGVRTDAGGLISGFGTITTPAGMISDGGTIVASGGTLLLNGQVGGPGVLDIAAGATLDIAGSQIGRATIAFTGANGVLELSHGLTDQAVIAGFVAGDTIEMAGVSSLSFNATTDVLTLSQGGTVVDTLTLSGTYASNAFTLAQSSAGALITLSAGTTPPVQAPVPVAPPATHTASSNLLPPGLSQALYAALGKATLYFDGDGQAGTWSDPGNWWNGTPGAGSAVVVPVSTTLNGAFAAKSVMLLGSETVALNGTLTTSSTDLCESFMVCDGAVANFAAGSALNDAGGLVVGNDSDGTLTAAGGGSGFATLASLDAKIGRLDGGVGVVDIAGGQWTNATVMMVGVAGQGALSITNAGIVTVGTSLVIGDDQGSSGQVTVANGGTLAVYATIDIGNGNATANEQGAGMLTVGAGGLVTYGSELNVYVNETLTMAGGTLAAGAYGNGVRVAAGGVVSGFGTIATPSGQIADCGTIVATGGTLLLNGYLGGPGGVLDIAAGATADIAGSTIGHVTIAFTGANGELALAHGISDVGVIADFATGDSILMAGVNSLAYNATTGVMTLSEGSTQVDKLQFAGAYSSNAFTMTQTGTGALITLGAGH